MLTKTKYKNSLVIYTNSKKDKLGFGNYLRILSILPNLKFKKFFWVSDKKPLDLVKNSDVINKTYNAESIQGKKLLKEDLNIINLFEIKKSTDKIKYFQNFINKRQNIKESGNDLCKIFLKIYNINRYKLFHNKQNKKFKTDLFINYIVPKKWKIKEYPIQKLKKIEKKLRLNNNKIKIKWQNRQDTMSQYIQKIKEAKLLLTIIGLGTHIGMMFNKKILVLAGPTYFEDLKKYRNKRLFFPKKICECQTKYLNKGIYCKKHINKKKSCMDDIDDIKLFNNIIKQLKKDDKRKYGIN